MDLRAFAMGTIFALIWASAFTSARVIVEYAPPITALCLRFAISGVIGVVVARAMGQSWRLSRSQWIAVITFGVCQNAIYLGFNFVALQWVEASLAAIIASSMPLLVALASWLVFQDRLPVLGYVGLGAGMAGVALIMGARLSGGADLLGVIFCVIGVLSLTVSTLAVRGTKSDGNVLMIVGLQMLVGATALAGPAVVLEVWDITWTWQLIVAFAYTTLFPGLVATVVWFLLVNRIGATRAAVYHFLTPFFGVSVAAVLLAEPLRLTDIIGVAIVAGGILAVQISRNPTKV